MTPEELKDRRTAFAVETVTFCRVLRTAPEARSIAGQLSDAATSVASNYRAACRARSKREFVSKLAVAVEEADESVGWLKVILQAQLAEGPVVADLLRESQECPAHFTFPPARSRR